MVYKPDLVLEGALGVTFYGYYVITMAKTLQELG